MSWQEQLRTQGFALFPGLTPEPLVRAAREAIETDLSSNYDPERKTEYDNRSFCPDLKGTPPIMNLLVQSPVHNLLDDIFSWRRLVGMEVRSQSGRHTMFPNQFPQFRISTGSQAGGMALMRGKSITTLCWLECSSRLFGASLPETLLSGPARTTFTRTTFVNAVRER